MSALLLELADDELVLGWRESEWTGIAPILEEDVALSSIAQNEIGHARAAYELLGDDPDALAFDRAPEEYRCAPLVQLRLLEWERAIARRWLYEVADELRLEHLVAAGEPGERALAEKMQREEVYHRLHAAMWRDRLGERLHDPVRDLWPYALGVLAPELRGAYAARVRAELGVELRDSAAAERGTHVAEWQELWNEMTSVRRSAPAGAQW